jgi:glycerol kinase
MKLTTQLHVVLRSKMVELYLRSHLTTICLASRNLIQNVELHHTACNNGYWSMLSVNLFRGTKHGNKHERYCHMRTGLLWVPHFTQVADQAASLFGSCCFEEGDVKVTMGTGTFLNVNTGYKPQASVAGKVMFTFVSRILPLYLYCSHNINTSAITR